MAFRTMNWLACSKTPHINNSITRSTQELLEVYFPILTLTLGFVLIKILKDFCLWICYVESHCWFVLTYYGWIAVIWQMRIQCLARFNCCFSFRFIRCFGGVYVANDVANGSRAILDSDD